MLILGKALSSFSLPMTNTAIGRGNIIYILQIFYDNNRHWYYFVNIIN
ncbi:hypothetical protein BN1088_1432841 [Sphingobacterium sp. PM2-P1-29]|nr:hypothetical protein BN1088_1432841 [Sphingobacterium sp. PM2-P1-29]